MILIISDFDILNKTVMLKHWLELIELVVQSIPFEFPYFSQKLLFLPQCIIIYILIVFYTLN